MSDYKVGQRVKCTGGNAKLFGFTQGEEYLIDMQSSSGGFGIINNDGQRVMASTSDMDKDFVITGSDRDYKDFDYAMELV